MTLLRNLVAVLLTLVAHLPATVVGECTCDAGDDKGADRGKALRYKLGALASILVAGGVGVVLPMLGRALPALRPEKDLFFVVKAFAAGVILATGFIHVLPDAFENLTSPCLPDKPWADFPFTGFTAMAAAIGVLSIDVYAASYYQRTHFRGEAEKVAVEEGNKEMSGDGTGEHAVHVHVHTHATHGHSHGASTVSSAKDSGAMETLRHRVVSQVLELGIVVHSVIIGVSLGASESISTIKPLIAALSFHQFFEGMGLGGCITQAKFKGVEATVMGLFFCLTTPIGIAVGIAISSGYDENSHTALIIEGVLNAASAGILIYMALVDLIAADFMSPRMQSNGRLMLASNLALLVGAGCMSLLAKWA